MIKCILKRVPFVLPLYRELRKAWASINFIFEFRWFKKISNSRTDFSIEWKDRYPCLSDKTTNTGFDRHYVFHTAWAARIVAETMPEKHIDISSSLYFCSIVSAFVNTEFYDYRPANLNLGNLKSRSGDLLKLPFPDNSVASLSTMHVVEHIGLGRYGDPVDPMGDIKAIHELTRVLADDGNLLFVVPVGAPRIMFNAHRIYSYEQILKYFSDLTLMEFALIPDDENEGGLIRNASPTLVLTQSYACGCFHFKKIKSS